MSTHTSGFNLGTITLWFKMPRRLRLGHLLFNVVLIWENRLRFILGEKQSNETEKVHTVHS